MGLLLLPAVKDSYLLKKVNPLLKSCLIKLL